MEQPTVLVVSDKPEFSSAVTGRWQSERNTPAFTLMGGDVCRELDPEAFDAAIVGQVRPAVLPAVLSALELTGKPFVLLSEQTRNARGVRDAASRAAQSRGMVLRQNEGWPDALLLVMSEVLRRCEALNRARAAERANEELQRQAMLGGYMLEMRHSLNNALTSVLGNSELLLQEPGSLSAPARSQIDTIRNMSLRMHEVLQRFSSLEKELQVAERQAEKETGRKVRASAAGV